MKNPNPKKANDKIYCCTLHSDEPDSYVQGHNKVASTSPVFVLQIALKFAV